MPMPPYQVFCSTRACKNLATHKIAARWSDGVVGELKTYALTCEEHLPTWFARAREKVPRRDACQIYFIGCLVLAPAFGPSRRTPPHGSYFSFESGIFCNASW